MLETNSDLTLRTPLIFIKFFRCELPILVMTPILGFKTELK